MITIIDYGLGNLGSIKNMLTKIGCDSIITSNIEKITKSSKLILPGVGSFDNGMNNLKKRKMIPILNDLVLNKKIPILGICLGMQLLAKNSQEGNLKGLGWIDADTIKFINKELKVPHMGWNNINIFQKNKLFEGLEKEDTRFYFVHSYYVKCNNSNNILTTTNYGLNFTSSINKQNIYGVQFHPEKSHKFGMQLLENFVKI